MIARTKALISRYECKGWSDALSHYGCYDSGVRGPSKRPNGYRMASEER